MWKVCRNVLFLRTKRCIHLTQTIDIVIKRYLYSADVLGITYYEEERQKTKQHSFRKKDDFLKSLETRLVHDGKFIFTEEIESLLYLTEPDDDFDLLFKVVQRYQELQEKSPLKTDFPLGITMLLMLYYLKRADVAFKWFLENKNTVNPVCRSRRCFLIMMDMLHDKGRHKDVITLINLCEKFIDRKYPEHLCLVISSFYKMNSKKSFKQMLYLLNEQSKDPLQLTDRCAMLCCMLAYKQGKMDLIEEIMQLPIFVVARKQPTSLMFNMKVLCYIKTGKIKLAAEILKDFTCSYNDSYPIIFDEVLLNFESEARKYDDSLMVERCMMISNTLRVSRLVVPMSLEEFLVTEIKIEEFNKLTTAKNPLNIHNKENRYRDLEIVKYVGDHKTEKNKDLDGDMLENY